jgi:hypothetical protein
MAKRRFTNRYPELETGGADLLPINKRGIPMESSTRTLISDRNVAERRLAAIRRAIEAHRSEASRKPYPTRSEDLNLYRRTREILGG